MKLKHALLGLLSLSGLLFFSCNNESTGSETTLTIDTRFKVGTANLNTSTEYLLNAKKIKYQSVKIYLSNFAYKTPLGSSFETVAGSRALLTPSNNIMKVALPEPLTLDRIKIGVGVPPAYNNDLGDQYQDPGNYPADDPLNGSFGTFLSNAIGYAFITIEGMYDKNGNGTLEPGTENFTIKAATNLSYRTLERDVHIIVPAEGTTVFLEIDIAQYFGGLNLDNNMQLIITNSDDPAYSIIENLVNKSEMAFGTFYQ